ncbi:MAG: radical SAM family heme chaperone HemW [Gammaproteobacteria bacterium]
MKTGIPLSLYVHLPWCVEKCPYCDFNSHEIQGELPEQTYIDALFRNVEDQLPAFWGRRIDTMFIGGGTPSLFSGASIERLMSGLRARLGFVANMEVTLESNPGTADASNYAAYREAGINRLSIGVQSLDNEHLKTLGRIHSADEAIAAIAIAKQAGFERINADLMYGLANQTVAQALDDLKQLIDQDIEHISWYQLTIEPNTVYYSKPPAHLPDNDFIMDIQQAGAELLLSAGYHQYEISAWAKPGAECQHNLNYWQFGDYVGIGAGAHGKITDFNEERIYRTRMRKQPDHWLQTNSELMAERTAIAREDLALEFFLNVLRLNQGAPKNYLFERTGLMSESIQAPLDQAVQKGLLAQHPDNFVATELGRNYLNDLLALFMPEANLIMQTKA